MSRTTRLKSELKSALKSGAAPDGPEVAKIIARARHHPPLKLAAETQAVQQEIKTLMEPLTAREALWSIWDSQKIASLALIYLLLLPFGKIARFIRSRR